MLMIFLGVCQRSPGSERRRQGGLGSPPGCAPEGGGPVVRSGQSSGSRCAPALPANSTVAPGASLPAPAPSRPPGEAPRPPSRGQGCGVGSPRWQAGSKGHIPSTSSGSPGETGQGPVGLGACVCLCGYFWWGT